MHVYTCFTPSVHRNLNPYCYLQMMMSERVLNQCLAKTKSHWLRMYTLLLFLMCYWNRMFFFHCVIEIDNKFIILFMTASTVSLLHKKMFWTGPNCEIVFNSVLIVRCMELWTLIGDEYGKVFTYYMRCHGLNWFKNIVLVRIGLIIVSFIDAKGFIKPFLYNYFLYF